MPLVFKILQIFISLGLIGLILLQAKGVGLGRAFGGGGEFYSTRRGVEKILFYFTIFLSFLFGAISFVNLIL